jgi:uncharacterized lipoprotein YbaY
MTATTITLFTKTLDGATGSYDEFQSHLPGYIARLRAALPEGVTLEVNHHDLSTASLRDDDDQALAEELSQRVEFWA